MKGVCIRLLMGILLGFFFVSCTPKPIKIGFIGGLSGFNSDLGISGRNGVSLAIDAINSQGGIRGRRIELLIRDDKQDPKAAVSVFRELAAERVVAIIGPMTSSIARELIPLSNESHNPLISPTASSPDFSGLDDMFIRLTTPNTNEALGLAYETHKRGAKKPCVVDDLSNQAFSQPLARTYTAEFRRLSAAQGGDVPVVVLPYDPKDPLGTQTLLTGLERYKPDLVLFTTNSLDTAILAQLIRRSGYTMSFLGTGWSMSQSLIENGGHAVEGMAFTVPFNPQSEAAAWKQFVQKYSQAFGKAPDFGAAQGWNAVLVFAQAIKEGGTRNIKQKIINKQYEGLQGPFSIDPYGDPVIPFQRLEIRSGKLVATP